MERPESSDYLLVLEEIGVSEEYVREVSENTSDCTPFDGPADVEISESEIEGLGLFTIRDFEAGEFVAPARVAGKRTPAGRYVNHSHEPNAEYRYSDKYGSINLHTIKPVPKGEELTVNYRDAWLLARHCDMLEQYEKLEEAMLQLPQVSVPVKHHFGPGVYMREITMPAGAWAMGHAHRHDCVNIVISGKASMMGEDGRVVVLEGPKTFLSKAFQRKLGFIHEDLTHITVHPNPDDVRDLDKLEEMLLVKSEAHRNYTKEFGDPQHEIQESLPVQCLQ